MEIKKLITITVVILLAVPVILGIKYSFDFDPEEAWEGSISSFDPTIEDWYTGEEAIQPRDIEFCRKWGGSAEAGINTGATPSTIPLSQLTATLQAEKTEYREIEDQPSLYRASWYIEPVSDISYKVYLTEKDEKKEIGGGQASNTEAGIDYYTEYLEQNFTHIRMEYDGSYIQVPVVILGEK
ncbi:hypothetical protein KY358_01080 [Candidatus Woesearchaeota archaeon]|nr:hypothetical protein [Candidatus Woesearchaeota archaeon]